MQEDLRLTPPERELEIALSGLQPAHRTARRDQVMFHAGYAAARRQGHVWQGVSVCLGMVLAVSIVWRSVPVRVQTVPDTTVVHDRSSAPRMEWNRESPVTDSGQAAEYVRLRQAVLERGMDALPAWRPVPHSASQVPMDQEHLEDLVSSI